MIFIAPPPELKSVCPKANEYGNHCYDMCKKNVWRWSNKERWRRYGGQLMRCRWMGLALAETSGRRVAGNGSVRARAAIINHILYIATFLFDALKTDCKLTLA